MEIRRIEQTEAEAVTDLWDEAGRSVPDGGALKERGRRNIAAMLVLAASSHRAACFVDDSLSGFVLAELAEDGLLPCQYGRIEELYARGVAELERALVQAAVEWLWEHDVLVIRSEVSLDEPGGENRGQNAINSISPKHPYYNDAVKYGESWLKQHGL